MLRSKSIDRICCIVLAVTLALATLVMGACVGASSEGRVMGYETRLFDQSRVHTIDLVMDDWEGFLSTCTDEEYVLCNVVVDGEAYKKVGIRAKGNTSLSSVKQYGNDRYSFKIEFDHYQKGRSYYGLDKLSLNNLIQDKTCMKDYLAYTLMNRMGVAAPLCSFVQISVNGEAWGLYLAVEGVEEGFLERNYGNGYGELYKPDSLSFGGGRGNGGGFDMDDFKKKFTSESVETPELPDGNAELSQTPETSGLPEQGGWPDASGMPDMGEMPDMDNLPEKPQGDRSGGDTVQGENSFENSRGGMSGMGSSDVKLQYIDDDASSYANIFDNAKTDITDKDKARLISSLKTLSAGGDVSSVVDVEAVIRYFVVHNFLCNDDSYTGQMVHNYYLYEKNGVLSMIPWDYNLAFGAFSMGGASGATSTVNTPIDTLVSQGDLSDRPMAAWIFDTEETTALYHETYAEFIADVFDSGWMESEIERVSEMIAPYVEADPTAFYTYEEFCTAIESLQSFCKLRAQSIEGQLDGSIPSTTEAQRRDDGALIDASEIDLSDMGEFNTGGGGGMHSGDRGTMERGDFKDRRGDSNAEGGEAPEPPQGGQMPEMAEGQTPPEMPSSEGILNAEVGEAPELPQGGQMPEMAEGQTPPEKPGESN